MIRAGIGAILPSAQRPILRNATPRERVQREIGRAFAKYEWIAKLSLTNIAFRELNGARVTATFDKEWDFRGSKGFAGSEKQEMVFVKKDGRWLMRLNGSCEFIGCDIADRVPVAQAELASG